MKSVIKDLVEHAQNQVQGRNIIREYLQARILGMMQNVGAMIPLAFCGGTALRFLYDLHHFSEDLDFSIEQSDTGYDFRKILNHIQTSFTNEGYQVMIKVSDDHVVHSAFIKFENLLYEMGISPHQTELLSIKLEVDTKPPKGAILETSLVRRHILLRLQHHDRSSLLSGKLHAFLQRDYTKGRDIYDLMWYLSDRQWPEPNIELLSNALEQTGWSGSKLSRENWREMVYNHLETVNWNKIRNDVQPFLERPSEIDLLTEENLAHLLNN
jgi:predicted nucleotidyltransferase component of viral defense system